jgi:WD40 repeat protein
LRVRMRLSEAPELADLPWEYLYDQTMSRFLALSQETPLVRYLDLAESVQPLKIQLPLRVLVMISSPTDYPELDSEREWTLLQQALGDLVASGQVVVERLEDATLATLRATLRRQDFHVLHFIGHGYFDRQIDCGVLMLEDNTKRGRSATGDELGVLLHDHRSLRIAILNACEGARGSIHDPFSGVAQRLVQQGIPAVVAMQFEISDQAAITFGKEFYAPLADGYPVDAALAETRKAIFFAEGTGLEWGTPVLYMRSPDGIVFERQASGPVVEHAQAIVKRAPQPAIERPKRVVEATPVPTVERPKRVVGTAPKPAASVRPAGSKLAAPSPANIELSGEAWGWKSKRVLRGHTQWVNCVAFSPDQTALASGCYGIASIPEVWMWGLPKGEKLYELTGPDTYDTINSLAFSPDGALLAAAAIGQTYLWKVENVMDEIPSIHGSLVAFSPDGKLLATASLCELRFWLCKDWKAIRMLEVEHEIATVAFSPDGALLAVGLDDGKVQILQVSDWKWLLDFEGHKGCVRSVAFSPDGALLASGSEDGDVRLWRLDCGKWPRPLKGHKNWVRSVAFSPDGRTLASCSDDRTIRIWSVSEMKLREVLDDHTDEVLSVAFSPDGKLLASGSADKSVRLWSLTKTRAKSGTKGKSEGDE